MDKLFDGWERVLTDRREEYINYVNDWESRIGSFIEFNADSGLAVSGKEGPLKGIPFGIKDNFAVENFNLTCGSKILENLKSPYTATSVQKLIDSGAVPVGKTNLDEFGMGSSTDNSAILKTNNPWDTERVAGGSSGGSAAAVAANIVPFALGSDTGGSVRQPASFCGVYGLKPTYGVVSRHGLTAYASSLDVVGVLSKKAKAARYVFDIIKGTDTYDNSSVEHPGSPGNGRVEKIGILKTSSLSPEIEKAMAVTKDRLLELGFDIEEVELPALDYVVPAYYTIATAEASANLARFNGIRYGYRSAEANDPGELMQKSRDTGFGDEVKLRILLGTYVLRSGFQDQYYHRAQKIRTAIRNQFDVSFTECDLIMMPVFPTTAFRHGSEELDPFQQKIADKFTLTANLTGYPAMAMPSGIEGGLPAGVQFTAPAFEEERLFNIAELLEKEFPSPDPAGVKNWS